MNEEGLPGHMTQYSSTWKCRWLGRLLPLSQLQHIYFPHANLQKTQVMKQNSLNSNVLCIYDIITTITSILVKKYSFILTQSFINISNNVGFFEIRLKSSIQYLTLLTVLLLPLCLKFQSCTKSHSSYSEFSFQDNYYSPERFSCYI